MVFGTERKASKQLPLLHQAVVSKQQADSFRGLEFVHTSKKVLFAC